MGFNSGFKGLIIRAFNNSASTKYVYIVECGVQGQWLVRTPLLPLSKCRPCIYLERHKLTGHLTTLLHLHRFYSVQFATLDIWKWLRSISFFKFARDTEKLRILVKVAGNVTEIRNGYPPLNMFPLSRLLSGQDGAQWLLNSWRSILGISVIRHNS